MRLAHEMPVPQYPYVATNQIRASARTLNTLANEAPNLTEDQRRKLILAEWILHDLLRP